jgi:hypothetical protein
MSEVRQILRTTGIADVSNVYSIGELRSLNGTLDPFFAERSSQSRSYAYSSDLLKLGILDQVLSAAVIRMFFDVLDDPVLYHFHIYEIAGRSDKSHIFSDELDGWHRDPDSVFEPGAATHVSLFVYLSDVGPESGPFQFVPGRATGGFATGIPSVSQIGPAGTAFLWNRNFFHRAAPNRSAVRRRLLKISIQNNRFPSRHLAASHFAPIVAERKDASPWHQILLGAFQGKEAPTVSKPEIDRLLSYRPSSANSRIDVSAYSTMKHALKHRVKSLMRPERAVMADAAYD